VSGDLRFSNKKMNVFKRALSQLGRVYDRLKSEKKKKPASSVLFVQKDSLAFFFFES
jgi:hypothetical protein